MKKGRLIYFIVGTLLLIASGCSNGGVEVGNPSQTNLGKENANRSGEVKVAANGYTVFVKEQLDVNRESEDKIVISNESLYRKENPEDQAGSEISKVELITHRGFRSYGMDELKTFVEGRRNVNWTKISRGNLKGYGFEENGPKQKSGEYYFLLADDQILEVRTKAFSAANGLVWVAQIWSTIQPSPQVHNSAGSEAVQDSPSLQ